jgi:hypothetical protein
VRARICNAYRLSADYMYAVVLRNSPRGPCNFRFVALGYTDMLAYYFRPVDKAGFNTEDTPYPLLLSSHYPSPVHTPRRSMRCSPHNLSADPYALLSVHRCIKFQFIISATPTFLPFLHSCYIIGLHPRPRSTAHLWRTLVCFGGCFIT